MAFRYLISPYAATRHTPTSPLVRRLTVAEDLPLQRRGHPEPWREAEIRGDHAIVLVESNGAPLDISKAQRRAGVEILPDFDPLRKGSELTPGELRRFLSIAEGLGYTVSKMHGEVARTRLDERLSRKAKADRTIEAMAKMPLHVTLRAMASERFQPRLDEGEVKVDGRRLPSAALPLPRFARNAIFPEYAALYYDTNNEADSNPADGWDALGGLSNLRQDSGELYGATGSYPWALYGDGADVGPNVMAYAEIPEVGMEHWIGARIADTPPTAEGYGVTYHEYASPTALVTQRYDAGVLTTLGAAGQLDHSGGYADDGDAVGIFIEGSDVTMFWRNGGVWKEYQTRTDATYSDEGKIALYMDSSGGSGYWGQIFAGTEPPVVPCFATYFTGVAWSPYASNAFVIGDSELGGTDQLVSKQSSDFGGQYDDVTLNALEVNITRGRDDPYQAMPAGSCTIKLEDIDQTFNPINPSSPIADQMTPMRPVSVTATYEGTTYPLFYGFLRSIEHDPRTRITTIYAEDGIFWLGLQRPVVSTQTNQTTAYIINEILDAAGWDADRRTITLADGDTVPSFSMAGTASSRTAIVGISELLLAERGIFYMDAAGNMVYEPRRDRTFKTSGWTISDQEEMKNAIVATDVERLINRVRITKEGGVEQEATNPASVTQYGPHDFGFSTPYLADDAAATSLAESIVGQRSEPQVAIRELPLSLNVNADAIAGGLGVELGDRVTLASSVINTAGDFHVEGVRHTIQSAGEHRTTLVLTKRGTDEVFVIGESAFGGPDRLAH